MITKYVQMLQFKRMKEILKERSYGYLLSNRYKSDMSLNHDNLTK